MKSCLLLIFRGEDIVDQVDGPQVFFFPGLEPLFESVCGLVTGNVR